MVERLRNDYVAARGREKLLAAAVAKEKADVGALSQLLIQHNLLKREFDTNQQLYDSLLQRLKDATVSAGLRATNIHVVDARSEEHTSELQSHSDLVCRLLLEKKK